ncbi:hypothetical protein L5515_002334 [Caenorhabditis briggsae]|uniref:guanylate cyclase n=1 Tax=Caenorhabditis briggsae TaxID=6238 RepID=A0AAE9DWT1_CAEBR|nr:hypothetical protein L3Y34_016270 [Caenorhabditis briggsae]UMM14607.1 hypothetical protein L5515_002334 [Caenorhabditis briggsae]
MYLYGLSHVRWREEFADCTLLFTDIVTFTNICALCTPYDVVTLLNDLYLRFDRLVGLHDAYKVETIGDAYMIVGGVPEHCENHAERVLNISIGMLMESKLVLSPITHKPIKIRLGVHCGPVVAGVVGIKMPRYCLFGDTVNVANKMESNGIQCKIHVSESAKLNGLKANPSYVFIDRGNTEIRGKGMMYTFFLERNDRKSVWELCARPRSGEQTIDGYMELHDQAIYQEEGTVESQNAENGTTHTTNASNNNNTHHSGRKMMNGSSVDPGSHHVRSPTCTIC